MNTLNFSRPVFFFVAAAALALSLAGCSDDTEKTAQTRQEAFDHPHDYVVTDIQKHKFEHDFAKQCVDRELKNSSDPEADKERFDKSCMCIARYLMKDLTAEEAEKFISEHENPRSLEIKFDSAAYHCLQEKTQVKGPQFNRKN